MPTHAHVRLELEQRIARPPHRRHIRQSQTIGVSFRFGLRFQHPHRVFAHALVKRLRAQKQGAGRQHRALGVALEQAVAILRVLPKALKGRLHVAVQHHASLLAQVVEHGGRFFKKQRQVVLDARGGHAVAHVFVDAAFGRVAVQEFAPALAEQRARSVVHRELAPRQQTHLGHGVEAALAVGVEGADGVDLVVEQIHAVRHQRAHGEEVDQATAHRVLAGAHHLRDVLVARQGQLAFELRFVQALLDLELEGVGRQKRGWRQAVQGCGGRDDDHVGVALPAVAVNAPQRGQALRDQVLVRRKRVVRQGFPIWEQSGAHPGREKRQLVLQALRVAGVGGDDGK